MNMTTKTNIDKLEQSVIRRVLGCAICLLVGSLSVEGQTEEFKGFYNFSWDEKMGALYLDVPEKGLDNRFLYVTALAAGVGSNDLGLDRGQLGDQKVVYWYKSGKKLLLIEDNLKYRAVSDNAAERKAVNEAFAESVIYGFQIIQSVDGNYRIDMSPFLMRDAHKIGTKLRKQKEGEYKIDKTRSVVYKEGLFAFPDNCEFESILTFAGSPKGKHLETVSPDPNVFTTRQHHSFIRLPDDGYEPRVFMPESGYIFRQYYDYATPIEEPLVKRMIIRHRLEKKNPRAARSEAKEPIIYYIDPGCPEPIKSALIEGASWWNEAYEAAGFINAFQVKELPSDAHPLDVRYNVIQWVHRSTRGWSYGASIVDPRTGEILKGHVSLGSLRVRQDFMIAQGLIAKNDPASRDKMKAMALDRLKQLSAHEIGHTIGLAHNFAASGYGRASVMDYPHPLITSSASRNLDFSDAYDMGIGAWDKRAIVYGYSYAEQDNEEAYLRGLIEENRDDGLLYITDKDARPMGGIHPTAHLWDNGADAVDELGRIIKLRDYALKNFSSDALPENTPLSELEKVLVPVYLMHRYQVDGASKVIGGLHYDYTTKTNDTPSEVWKTIDAPVQKKALQEILKTLQVEFLKIPESVLSQIPPPAFGYPRDRETFKGHTGEMFDPIAAAEASANHTLNFLLHPERLTRISQQGNWTIKEYFQEIKTCITNQSNNDAQYGLMLHTLFIKHLIKLSKNTKTSSVVALGALAQLQLEYANKVDADLRMILNLYLENPNDFDLPKLPSLPPGSPIGCY